MKPPEESRYRYPGPRSFAEMDQRLFFGRKQEIATLTHRVRASRHVVLFGKSGLGKTSLLQAGLYPSMRRYGLLPVPVRLDRTATDAAETILAASLATAEQGGVEVSRGLKHDLWRFFRTTDFWLDGVLLTPVLILDQFEEVFTLHEAPFRQKLVGQLRDLLSAVQPQSVQEMDAHERQALAGLPRVRVLIALREEYLGALEELTPEIPAILENRFRLRPLTQEAARLAIESPASVVEPSLASPSFAYDEATLAEMLALLSNKPGEIEPFQLQVLCRHCERRVIEQARTSPEPSVDERLVPLSEMKQTLAEFYRDSLRRIASRRQRRSARSLCERGLLSPEDKRISLDEGAVRHRYKLSANALEVLIDQRIVRRDTRPGLEGYYYELSHDSLVEPVRRNRNRTNRIRRTAALVTGLLLTALLTENVAWTARHGYPVTSLYSRWAYRLGVEIPMPTFVKVSIGPFLDGEVWTVIPANSANSAQPRTK